MSTYWGISIIFTPFDWCLKSEIEDNLAAFHHLIRIGPIMLMMTIPAKRDTQ